MRLREIDLPKSLSKDVAKAELEPGSSGRKPFALSSARSGPPAFNWLSVSKIEEGS